jgi:hypothetical protein
VTGFRKLVLISINEAKIRRMAIKGQPRQIVYETLSQKKKKKILSIKKGCWGSSSGRAPTKQV